MLADIIPGYAVFCSAQGDCINSGNSNPWQSVGGTSAATPLLAGGFALVDEELRMHNRQDLGLANPLLYTLGRSSTLSGQRVRRRPFATATTSARSSPATASRSAAARRPGLRQGLRLGQRQHRRPCADSRSEMQPPQIGLSLPGGQKPVRSRQILAP